MDVIVVGGGISGLSVAYEIETLARARGVAVAVRVLESADRVGGKVDTRREQGFVIEGGVNGWLGSKVVVDALAERVGLGEARVAASAAAKRRYLWKGVALEPLPMGPLAFARSRLLGARGKLRLFWEPFAAGPPPGEETVAEFFTRRLGARAAAELVDPMVSGIHAGDPAALSVASAFPKLARFDREHGGLVRGFVAEMRAKRRERAAAAATGEGATPAKRQGRGPALVSFVEGASQLTDRLASLLAVRPEVGREVTAVQKRGGGYAVRLASGEALGAEQVVLAAPAYASATMLADLDGELSRELAAIPYAPIAVVALAWPREQMPHPLDGYGFLVPGQEGRDILGALWDSSVFAGRAPDGQVLVRVMIGGARRPELVARSDAELIAMASEALRATLGVSAAPALARAIRHERGIPQYVVGHGPRLARVHDRLASHAGLHLAGNAYHGISLADCVAHAPEVAERVLAAAGGTG